MLLSLYISQRRRREEESPIDRRHNIEEEGNFEGAPNVNVTENTTNCMSVNQWKEVVNIEEECTYEGTRKLYPA